MRNRMPAVRWIALALAALPWIVAAAPSEVVPSLAWMAGTWTGTTDGIEMEEHWTSPPPHGVGSTRHAVATVLGRRTENDAVATEFQPPHRAAMEGTSPNVVAARSRSRGCGRRAWRSGGVPPS